MAWVVELNGYDIANAAARALRFSLGRGIAFTDGPYCPGALMRWQSATQKISFDDNGQVQSGGDSGEVKIVNLADSVYVGGPLDSICEWAWQGREATFWWVPAAVWADRMLMGRGVLEQPVANLAIGAGDESTISFPIRDPRSALIAPFQTKTYGGTNVAPDGTDGSADLKDQPRPILYGTVSNIPGVLVNSDKQIYQLADKYCDIFCCRDGGLPLIPGVQRANLASLEANEPGSGNFDYLKTVDGTYARLGQPPIGRLTFDAGEGANAADRTHAKIWRRIRMERCGNLDAELDYGTTNTLAPEVAGWWWPSPMKQRDALDELLASLSGYEVQDQDGVWHLAQLRAPTGDPLLNFLVITEESTLRAIDRPIIDATRVRPNYAPNGAPPYAVTVRWGFNHTVMSARDFLGGAYDADHKRLVDKFSKEWRTSRAKDDTIWNPDTNTGLFPNAPELTITTSYQPGADFVTSPHADAEAARILALLSGLKAQYQIRYSPDPGDYLLPGMTVQMTYPGHNLGAGPKFIVLQAGLTVESQRQVSQVVIGLQT